MSRYKWVYQSDGTRLYDVGILPDGRSQTRASTSSSSTCAPGAASHRRSRPIGSWPSSNGSGRSPYEDGTLDCPMH
jgi:hypothetical protein